MKAVSEILDWFSDQLQKLPSRTTPLAVFDLNDQMGDMGSETREDIDDEVVGASFPGPEGFAAKQLRAILRLHRFCLLNTFENSGPTYWGPRQGTKSRIDFVAAPLDFKSCKQQCRILEKNGRCPSVCPLKKRGILRRNYVEFVPQ